MDRKSQSLKKLEGIIGNAQDMINYLSAVEKYACLVMIDFGGLTTNINDLMVIVRNHDRLEKIIVDQLPIKNEVKVF
ncbi:hypothetical protein BCV72DRAFT_306206 [Rhizopus microsporus var. microsporus]|uniref:Uncharacterized protein n=2 Tax=Rhizopus microsporus TaxID=58291 RepID=A0A2G4SLF6_RHIZD|nr:uncharacterized protein RHIMIDRAFT_240275 [Rhizopus microsporus ATCC 52813]ORE05687.1 hypothetical protein BCV72DRAFT_306206 [Rhizopus microsporus var. microsporus]PHZ09599.1 hypothetical protein RHIMIDRAFT_240275 [Rhizopus microsporus ATCC 52813]